MLSLRGLTNRELIWTQPRFLKMEYELRAAGELAATLRFKSSFRSIATGECGDGMWSFRRSGFPTSRVSVHSETLGVETAVFRCHLIRSGGVLDLPDGRRLRGSANFWQTRYELKTETGEWLVRVKTGGLFRLTAPVEVAPSASALPAIPWMILLGFYLAVLMRVDSSHGSAAAAAGAS